MRIRSLSAVVAMLVASVGGLPNASAATAAGSQLWAKRYDGAGSPDAATSIATSPDGSTVFATGYSTGPTTGEDYATVAYDVSTGTKLWVTRYNGPGNGKDLPLTVEVSPDASRVFVTGQSAGSTTGDDLATVAYDASDGSQLWAKRYNGSANGWDYASDLGVSPDGTKVFVTGAINVSTDGAYATIAYDAATGVNLWIKRYNVPGNDGALSLAVSPDGTKVFVTGGSSGSAPGDEFLTEAYDASTGDRLWRRRYDGPAHSQDLAQSIAVSPGGGQVFVTGNSVGLSGGQPGDYATIAYDASTGTTLWIERYNGPGDSFDTPLSVVPGLDGTQVFVTGASVGSTNTYDYATIAYDASTGADLWIKRYDGAGNASDTAAAVGVSPDGSQVFVTGRSAGSTSGDDYATLAYDAATGGKLWARRYDGPAASDDGASALGVSPGGAAVFVTGGSIGSTTGYDYATVGYSVT